MNKSRINTFILLLEVALIVLLHVGKHTDNNSILISKGQTQPSVILSGYSK